VSHAKKRPKKASDQIPELISIKYPVFFHLLASHTYFVTVGCNNIAVSYLSYLLIFVKYIEMSVYSLPLKNSDCFTVAYDILDYHKEFILYISVLGSAGNLCYQSFAIYCTI